jgi:CBS domain-containing protein
MLGARGAAAGAATVGELMTPAPVATVELLEEVAFAEAKMEVFHVRHLPVMRRGRVVGIFSDRDLYECYRRHGALAREMMIGEVMTVAPFTVGVESDAVEAARSLVDRQIGALPVMRGDELAGILSKSDFLHYIRR